MIKTWLCIQLVVQHYAAGCIFENIGYHVTQTKLAEVLFVRNPYQNQVNPSFLGFVNDSWSYLTGLKHFSLYTTALLMSDTLYPG